MKPHVAIYFKHFGYSESDFIACECCQAKAVDVHHAIPRSRFGEKKVLEMNAIENLIAVCRACHDKIHNGVGITTEIILQIISKR